MSVKSFVQTFQVLDLSRKTQDKLTALADYFSGVQPEDTMWALYFFSGKKLSRVVPTSLMKQTLLELSELPEWLFKDSYASVGDLCETIALLMPETALESKDRPFTAFVEKELLILKQKDDTQKQDYLRELWKGSERYEIFVLNKLLTGGMRIGVSQKVVFRAFALAFDLNLEWVTHRLMGDWYPTKELFESLIASKEAGQTSLPPSHPYPFALAHPIGSDLDRLGEESQWIAEWKYDGIRGQFIKRQDQLYLWSRGEEEISEQFPDVLELLKDMPNGIVLDGEIVAMVGGELLPFQSLQRRIGRKAPGKKVQGEVPCRFIVYDVLEFNGEDIRQVPLVGRKEKLQSLSSTLDFAKQEQVQRWSLLDKKRQLAREQNHEGFMLKRKDSIYPQGRVTGIWWKWKTDPLTLDCVVRYAQSSSGRRAGLCGDYTLAVWNGDKLVPIAKAYSGLTDIEMKEMDRWIKANTQQRFGPVRQVVPEKVMEIAFEGITQSSRNKSGFALRFPRVHRIRTDKKASEANRLEDVQEMFAQLVGSKHG